MLLKGSGRPLLLDFGAARQVIGDQTQELTAILKPGFAPIEQYGETPGLEQGPWTDVYALAATLHWVLLGRAPAASVSRVLVDNQKPLVESAQAWPASACWRRWTRPCASMPASAPRAWPSCAPTSDWRLRRRPARPRPRGRRR
jgi:serine/threonine protein kinase